MRLQETDSGRSSLYSYEKNDCTVRAYALAKGIDYHAAHARLALAGRQDRKGFACMRFYNLEFGKAYPRMGITVKTFVQTATRGTYIIRISRHVFTVIDGVIHDIYPESNLNRRILNIWKVK